MRISRRPFPAAWGFDEWEEGDEEVISGVCVRRYLRLLVKSVEY